MAARKASGLLRCGAVVTVIAPALCDGHDAADPTGHRCAAPMPPGDAAGYRLVVTATGIPIGRRRGLRRCRGGRGVGQQRRRRGAQLVHPAVGAPRRPGVHRRLHRWGQPRPGVVAARPAGRERRARLGRAGRPVGPGAPSDSTTPGAAPRAWTGRALLDGPLPALVRAGCLDAGPRPRRGGHRASTAVYGCATMSAEPSTRSTTVTHGRHHHRRGVALHRLLRRRVPRADGDQRDLEPCAPPATARPRPAGPPRRKWRARP